MNGSFGAVNGDCVGLEQAENRSPCFVWTARALERCSFSVAENGDAAELSVDVSRKDGRGAWLLDASGQRQSYSSLTDLLVRLKTHEI